MLDTIGLFRALRIVETIKGSNEIPCDATDALKAKACSIPAVVLILRAPALRTSVADDAVISAHWIAIEP